MALGVGVLLKRSLICESARLMDLSTKDLERAGVLSEIRKKGGGVEF